MNNFIVSARKYRPSTFDTVVGQESITSTLKNAIKTNHLAHSYLFCGPRGVGKTTCARILAKTINCMNLTDNIEACDECESCKAFNTSRSFNIHELDAASNNKVDDIRTLTELVRIPPQVGRYSIYIIDEVHMLSTSAFNAFLKTLEEPPAHAIFILATTEKQKIIPTILSRCQIFDFSRITIDDIVKRLSFVASAESIGAEPEALHIIAQKADGAMRDALSIFDQIVSFSEGEITYAGVIENLNVLDYEYYLRIADAFQEGDLVTSLLIFSEILEKGFDGHNFISGLSSHYRNLLVSKHEKTLSLLEVGASIRDRYRDQSARIPLPFIYKALEILGACDVTYRSSRNPRLHVEIALIRLASLVTGETSDNGENSVVADKSTSGDRQKTANNRTSEANSSEGKQDRVTPDPKGQQLSPSDVAGRVSKDPKGQQLSPSDAGGTVLKDPKGQQLSPSDVAGRVSKDPKGQQLSPSDAGGTVLKDPKGQQLSPSDAGGTISKDPKGQQLSAPGVAGIKTEPSEGAGRKGVYRESESTRSFSIREKLQNGDIDKERVSDVGPGQHETGKKADSDTSFDVAMVKNSWIVYGEKLKGENPRMYSIVKGTSPEINGEGTVIIDLSTDAQKEFFEHNFKQDVIRHFRHNLNNSSVRVESIVRESAGSNTPYTDEEKYNYLAKKNPAINDLKRDLGLELE